MSDISMTAPAPAVAPPVAAPEDPVVLPNPITERQPETEEKAPEPKAKEAEKPKPPSISDAVAKAKAKVEADEKAAEKPLDAKAQAEKVAADKKAETEKTPAERARDETGKFAPAKVDAAAVKTEPSFTAEEPPKRFNDDAKAAWATAPETVRHEVARMERELTQGYEKHRADAEAFHEVREYAELSKPMGGFKAVLDTYMAIETELMHPSKGGNPIAALERICQSKGYSLREVAEAYLERAPDQQAAQHDQVNRQLQDRIAGLERQLSGVSQTVTTGLKQQATSHYDDFVKSLSETDRPLMEVLSHEISAEIETNHLSLAEAFAKAKGDAQEKAQRLGFIPKTDLPAPAAMDRPAHTERGQKSIAGAPGAGSEPATKKPSSTIKESIRRAMAAAG